MQLIRLKPNVTSAELFEKEATYFTNNFHKHEVNAATGTSLKRLNLTCFSGRQSVYELRGKDFEQNADFLYRLSIRWKDNSFKEAMSSIGVYIGPKDYFARGIIGPMHHTERIVCTPELWDQLRTDIGFWKVSL